MTFCVFLSLSENVKGFQLLEWGLIGSWFQNLAEMYENDWSPELLTLGRTKEKTLLLVL